jgi:hypothetical protein
MTPEEIAKSYDQIAGLWNSEEFPRSNGIKEHERAIAFVKENAMPLTLVVGVAGDSSTC